MIQVVPIGKLQAVAEAVRKPEPQRYNGTGAAVYESRLDVPKWLNARGVAFRMKDRPDARGRTVYLLENCPFDSGHGASNEVAIYQAPDGKLGALCMHDSCSGRGWAEFKQAIGPPDPDHWHPPLNGSTARKPHTTNPPEDFKTPFLWEPNIVAMSNIHPRAVEWLWKNRIPSGKLVSLSGNPGLGKTLVLMDISARVTTGAAWPDGCPGSEPGGVVVCSAEDDPYDTLRPRLDAANADVSRINLVQSVVQMDTKTKRKSERLIDLQQDRDAISQAIDATPNCKLLIMDPINAYLGKTDSHKNAEVRQVLGPIAEMCHRKGVAFIYLGHLNKTTNGRPCTAPPAAWLSSQRPARPTSWPRANQTRTLGFFFRSRTTSRRISVDSVLR